MARLNDPPAPMETIDALKRRFIRQNREIARVNSTQSLRIRTLEGEISHLLSENIALRQHIIRLEYDIDRYSGGIRLDDIGGIKEKLEAKLTEIGGLVQELGKIQTDAANRRSLKRINLAGTSPKKSPDQKVWKNVLSLAEVTGGADGRLPPIVEDKYYPRRTLDAEEFLSMLPDAADTVDSPELGPPPIAHFEGGDPAKTDPSGEDVHSTKPLISEDDIQPAMFANLETRKRRRETTNLRETMSFGIESDDLKNSNITEQPTLIRKSLKSGAKRKLDVAADQDREAGQNSGDDGFEFGKSHADLAMNKSSRSGPLRSETPRSEICLQEPGVELTNTNIREASAAISKSRKALGPKSSNMDPTSPSKVRKLGANSKFGDPKDRLPKRILDGHRLKEKPRNAVPSEPNALDGSNPDRMDSAAKKGRSETPTPASGEAVVRDESEPASEIPSDSKGNPPSDSKGNLLSDSKGNPPSDSKGNPPSDSKGNPPSDSKGNPPSDSKGNPPSDLDPDSSSTKGSELAERATRRPRGSVSYAEPNLRAKMRRPNKDLADAVRAEEQLKQAIMIPDGETQSQIDTPAEKGGLRTVIIKKENLVEPSNPWQIPSSMEDQNHLNQPEIQTTSPLDNRAKSQPVNELVDQIGGEEISTEKMPENKISGAGSAIAALSAGRSKSRKREEDEGGKEVAEARRDTFDLGATDSQGDGPGDGAEEIMIARSKRERDGVNGTIRSHRRHSSIPKEDGRPALAVSIAKRRERRRESLVSSSSSSSAAAAAAAQEVRTGTGTEMRSARSVGQLQAGGGRVGQVDGEIAKGGAGADGGIGRAERAERAERAASRRRSMML